MGNIITIKNKIFGKNSFGNVVNTSFTELAATPPSIQEKSLATIKTFFNDYDNLFYDIPITGSINSHLELINRSSDYLGISFIDMQTEINNLRQENVALKNQLYILTKP